MNTPKFLPRLRNAVFRSASRIFIPGIAEQMQREGAFYLSETDEARVQTSEHVIVEDRGSDVTIFSFSGLAVLFAGMPTFEFRKLLGAGGHNYNLVFFRDVRRTAYHMAPDGTPTGLEFYARCIEELKTTLGSKRHVALGASSGGSAAFYFGTRCKMDHIVAFSPGFPHTCYVAPSAQVRTFCDVKKLLTRPASYFEVAMVTLGAYFGAKRAASMIPPDRRWDVMDTFMNAQPRPRASIIYGQGCRPDTLQALQFKDTPEVKLIPVDSARHNCAGDLKKRGELGSLILAEIHEGLARAHSGQPPHDPS